MTGLIRPATASDAAAVHDIGLAAFAEQAWLDPQPGALGDSPQLIAAQLAEHGGLLALLDGRPVGTLRYAPDPAYPGRVRWVRRVAVLPAARRRGVARSLLRRAARDAAAEGRTALRAGVRRVLAGNHALYAGLGWQPVAEHPEWREFGLALPRPVPDAGSMRELGRRLAGLLAAGDLVVLAGPLGAGKTTAAQGIGAGLGVTDRITSPTFVLCREHAGRLPLLHVDAYRLGSLAELDELDLDTAMGSAVTVVEWGAGLAEPLADGHLLVRIDRSADPNDERREVTLEATGPAWAARQHRLAGEI